MATSSEIDAVLAEVGPRLKWARTQRDMTLTELAAATGISKSTLLNRPGFGGGSGGWVSW